MELGRASLLKATVRVVAKKGMRGLTFRSVAAEAGVTHGLVTHHFGTRDALITAAFREEARGYDARLTLAPGTGKVEDVGAKLSQIVEAEPLAERYQYEMILEALRTPELLEDVRSTYRSFVDAVRSELELIGNPDTDPLARLVFAALDGLILQQLVSGDADATEEAVARLQQLLRADRDMSTP